jgi:hypothetical protein
MARRKPKHALRLRAATVLIFVVGVLGFVFIPGIASENGGFVPSPTPTPAPVRPPRRPAKKEEQVRKPDYKEFPHDIDGHRADCASCHTFPTANWDSVRKGDDAFQDVTDYPKHESCVSCHREQFFRGAQPNICSVCHTNPSPRGFARHPFPNPREIFDLSPKGKAAAESDFKVAFPHEKHMELFGYAEPSTTGSRNSGPSAAAIWNGRARVQEASVCATCHTTLNPQGDSPDEYYTKPPSDLGDGFWLKRGTFKSNPLGHTQCFTCHSADTGLPPAPTDCSSCHQFREKSPPMDLDVSLLKKMGIEDRVTILTWRRRVSSAKFQHEFFAHSEISCNTCHNTNGMNTATAAGRKVRIMSCGGEGVGCHITPTLDDGGILNFEIEERRANGAFECTKCHVGFGRQTVPQSHVDALKSAASGQ